LRINPDVTPETHKYITTGHADNKFGISYKEIDEVAVRLPELKNIEITGLHFHIGSQIRNFEAFEQLCERANKLFRWFTERGFPLSHLNFGGGMGINYDDPEGEPIPDFARYFSIFAERLEVPEGVKIHFEPGRALVGQCGELIAQVLYCKSTAGGRKVVLIDAGMTELIRPALYQARHAIENLDACGRKDEICTIAGPVCESSDILVRDVTLPELRRGDLISILSAGAYGSAMASRYNLRDLPRAVYSDEV